MLTVVIRGYPGRPRPSPGRTLRLLSVVAGVIRGSCLSVGHGLMRWLAQKRAAPQNPDVGGVLFAAGLDSAKRADGRLPPGS